MLISSISCSLCVFSISESTLSPTTSRDVLLSPSAVISYSNAFKKNLPEILDIAFKYFPNKIKIWSNCINLSLYTDKLINRIKKYNIPVNLTLYIYERREIIEDFLIKNKINYCIFYKSFIEEKPEFFDKFFTLDRIPNNEDKIWCESKFNCCQLIDQKLYICQYLAYLPYLFDYFKDKDYSNILEYNNSSLYLDLNKINNYQEIVDYIKNYNEPICQHCIDKWMTDDFQDKLQYRVQDWSPSKKQVSEWIIDNIEKIYEKS